MRTRKDALGPRAEPAGTAAVEIRGLTKSFRGHLGIGRRTAVDGLDLTVGAGEAFGLLGPNGAGKTTTIKCLLGLLRPDRGDLRLLGRPARDASARVGVGYLPEQPYFYDYLTPTEFLDFYGRLQGLAGRERAERVARALARVGLAGREDVPLRRLSKGLLQRVGIAQAIQHDPRLVILDEPMSGLDPIGRREVRDLILELRGAGTTVFFSSHILQDAEMICDRVAILRDGRLVAAGRLDELVSGRLRGFDVGVVGAVHDLPGHVVSREADRSLLSVPDVESLTALLAAVTRTGGRVVTVWPRRETLEDLFLRTMGRAPEERE
jgi:ABC-2 type transport system ATP-binding protein